MNAPAMVPATLRGKAAVQEVQELLTKLTLIDIDIEKTVPHTNDQMWCVVDAAGHTLAMIDTGEVLMVLTHRRNSILTVLENKGIRVAPDPTPMTAAEEQPITQARKAPYSLDPLEREL